MLTNLLSSAIIVKMSADFLKGENMHTDIVEQIQKVMRESVESSEVTGVNLLVEKDDREIIYCQEGMADREENRRMSRDTIFRLYSQTKPVTGVAAMILMEQGCLDFC